jgi:hypothetical protein
MTTWTLSKHSLITAIAWAVLAFGCGTAPDSGAEYGDQAQDAGTLTPQERAERRQELSRKWQEVRDRLNELSAKVNADGVQNEWDEAVAKIDREAADLSRQLDEFGDDSRQAWDDFEARVQRSLDAMGREIDEAVDSK